MFCNQSIFDDQKLVIQEFRDLFLNQGFSDLVVQKFQEIIYQYYHDHKRFFSWRQDVTPYRVVISEVMLQQTQADRVAKKFDAFVQQFPTFQYLAYASFDHVLRYWKGLGYNRRALNIQKIAHRVIQDFKGRLPDDVGILATFPGIGKATAASICAFAFDRPTIFIETNIRTVFIYFFFEQAACIYDKDILPLVEKTLDKQQPRKWYYALMDYGVMLKKAVGNLSRLSKHYTRQSKFQGSDRQIRGMILQVLLDTPGIDQNELFKKVGKEEKRVCKILEQLCSEKFVITKDNQVFLSA
ncbi:MAG: A/G-specific adenine glycosylase [bacterium]